jgi:hypothetical protein
MANCKTCGGPMDWGFDNVTGRWVPLEPLNNDGDLAKTFVDENGVLRADHRDRCRGTSINVTRLTKKVPAEEPVPIDAPRKARKKKAA